MYRVRWFFLKDIEWPILCWKILGKMERKSVVECGLSIGRQCFVSKTDERRPDTWSCRYGDTASFTHPYNDTLHVEGLILFINLLSH